MTRLMILWEGGRRIRREQQGHEKGDEREGITRSARSPQGEEDWGDPLVGSADGVLKGRRF